VQRRGGRPDLSYTSGQFDCHYLRQSDFWWRLLSMSRRVRAEERHWETKDAARFHQASSTWLFPQAFVEILTTVKRIS
jgi:hypothetical protein